MASESTTPTELEVCIGFSTLECARFVMERHPEIARVQLRAYNYRPDTHDQTEPLLPVDRDIFMTQSIADEFASRYGENWNVVLDSLVKLQNGTSAHFLMMDLHPPKFDGITDFIREQMQRTVIPRFGGGFLLETNRSYQFFGTGIIPQDMYREYLAWFQLADKVTSIHPSLPRQHTMVADHRYIAYSHLRGTTGLRLTTRADKAVEPRVVAIV